MADTPEESTTRGRARESSSRSVDRQERLSQPRRDREVPEISEELSDKYVRIGNRLFRTADQRIAIVKLEPDRLKTRNIEALPDIIKIAKANGWTALRIEGGDTFKKAALLAAAAQGLDVENFAPTKRLKAEADRLRERFAQREAERGRNTGDTAGSPTEVEQRRQLAERFLRQSAKENARDPELKAAQTIVTQTLAIARARSSGNADSAARAGEAKRQEVAVRIARGDQITGIEVRARSTPVRTPQQDRARRIRH